MSNRFKVHGDGTFTDTDMDIMWKFSKEGEDAENSRYTYDEAINKFTGDDEFAGYDDWRLPTIQELEGLKDYLHMHFQETMDSIMLIGLTLPGTWSSTSSKSDSAYALVWRKEVKKTFSTIPAGLKPEECAKDYKFRVRLCRFIDD